MGKSTYDYGLQNEKPPKKDVGFTYNIGQQNGESPLKDVEVQLIHENGLQNFKSPQKDVELAHDNGLQNEKPSQKDIKLIQENGLQNGKPPHEDVGLVHNNGLQIDKPPHKDVELTNTKLEPQISTTEQDKEPYRSQKIVKTTSFVLICLILGMSNSIDGPSLPDLKERLGVSQEKLSLSLAFRSIGVPLGCILGGMLNDRYRRFSDLIGCAGLILLSASTIAKPLLYNLPALGVMSFVNGLGKGTAEAVSYGVIAWMYPGKSGPPMSAIHMGFSIGNTLAPILVMNFLSPTTENDTLSTAYSIPTTTQSQLKEYAEWNWRHSIIGHDRDSASIVTGDPFVTSSDVVQLSRIEIPYGILGGILCAGAILLLVHFIYESCKGIRLYSESKKSMKKVWSAEGFRSGNKSIKFTVVIIVLVCLLYASIGGILLDKFIFTYAVESELQFTKAEASVLNTVFNCIGIFARFMMIVITLKCPIEVVTMTSVILTTVSTGCLGFLGHKKRVYLWVFSCMYKVSSALIWPAATIWTSKQIVYSSMILAFVQLSASVSSFFAEWFSGYLYDAYSPQAFAIFCLAMSCLMLIIMVIMQIYASCYKKNHKEDSKPEIIDVWTIECEKYNPYVSTESNFTKL